MLKRFRKQASFSLQINFGGRKNKINCSWDLDFCNAINPCTYLYGIIWKEMLLSFIYALYQDQEHAHFSRYNDDGKAKNGPIITI